MTYTEEIKLTTFTCSCGGTYAISEKVREHAYKDSGDWHCPYCQRSWGYHETEAHRLRKELTAAKSETMRAHQLRAQADADALRAVLEKKRIEKRAKAALCPCCNRSFIALRRHLATKHPEFVNKPGKSLKCLTEKL